MSRGPNQLLKFSAALAVISGFTASAHATKKIDFEGEIRTIYSELISPKFNQETCAAVYAKRFDVLSKSDPSKDFDLRAIQANREKLTQVLFHTRLAAYERISKDLRSGKMSQDCRTALMGMVRAARHAEDYIGMLSVPQLPTGADPVYTGFQGPASWNTIGSSDVVSYRTFTLVNPKYGDSFLPTRDLKDGDIIIVRSDGIVSSAVTRMGDVESQFSHATLVATEPKTGKKVIVESILPGGVRIVPLEDHLKSHHHVRQVVLRPRRSTAGPFVAKNWMMFIHSKLDRGQKIPYDFYLNDTDYSKLNCSEMVRAAYDTQSDGRIVPGRYTTTSVSKLPKHFLESMGVQELESVFPGDFEADPEFEVVAEWRDYQRLNSIHIGDVVNAKIFSWMRKYDYKIFSDSVTRNLVATALSSRVLAEHDVPMPEALKKEILSQISPDMTYSFLVNFIQVFRVASYLEFRLSVIEKDLVRAKGVNPTPYQLGKLLERERVLDLQEFANPPRGFFSTRERVSIAWDHLSTRVGAAKKKDWITFLAGALPFHRVFRPANMADPKASSND